jgi:hypothetical protein
LATFHSFVNARYSDISVDCSDFDAGFLITYKTISSLYWNLTIVMIRKYLKSDKY